jgi:hypothetical protein
MSRPYFASIVGKKKLTLHPKNYYSRPLADSSPVAAAHLFMKHAQCQIHPARADYDGRLQHNDLRPESEVAPLCRSTLNNSSLTKCRLAETLLRHPPKTPWLLRWCVEQVDIRRGCRKPEQPGGITVDAAAAAMMLADPDHFFKYYL